MNCRKWKWMILTVATFCYCMGSVNVSLAADEAADDQTLAVAASAEQTSRSFDDWVDAVKNPSEWMNWGADLRLRQVYINNWTTLNSNTPGHEWIFSRFRGRVWTAINAADIFDFNAKITYEGRWYDKPARDWTQGDVTWDTFNFVFSDVLDQPLKITAGRQNIIKGIGWLVLEGTPLDGSRTIFNDAIVLDYAINDQNSVQAIYLQNHGDNNDSWLPPINDYNQSLAEEDERGVILWLNSKAVEGKVIDAYFIYEHDDAYASFTPATPFAGDNGDYYNIGGVLGGAISENLSYRAEGAYQWGVKNLADLQAFGVNTRLIYDMKDNAKSSVRFDFEMLSGDDPDTGRDEAFDPLWGRWPQFSELIIYVWAPETRIAQVTNMYRLGAIFTTHPIENMEGVIGYHYLLAYDNSNKATDGFSDSGKERGHLLTSVLRYKFNRYVSGHLVGEVFFPGDYYETAGARGTDTASFVRGELVFTF